ncbi:hypothetical protein SUREIYA_01750 [Serratia phage vB_SmaM-Sureiya]|nr:hypothetical protein SUREIYA_01750 [Serratia phage vB_SmaM-Sureiya]
MRANKYLPESINANEIDWTGAKNLDLRTATLEVKNGLAKLIIAGHAFHFEKIPMPIDWAGFQFGMKDREPQPIPRDTEYTLEGYLDSRSFGGNKFIINFITDDPKERPFVIRVGEINAGA